MDSSRRYTGPSMSRAKPRIAIPTPTAGDLPYNQQCWKQYAQALYEAEGEPVEIALHGDWRALSRFMDGCDGICLPGSPADVDPARYGAERQEASAPADPAREAVDFFLLDWAAEHAKPVLGICFGLQSLNVWSGGSLVQDLSVLPVNHSAGSSVAVAHALLVPPASSFATLLDSEEASPCGDFIRLHVNSSHHQAVGTPGDGLRIAARCPEDGVIEALELDLSGPTGGRSAARPPWLLGVQWHPERTTALSATSRALFRRLVAQATMASSSAALRTT